MLKKLKGASRGRSKFVIDNLNSLCRGHHKTHTMEVYDDAEDTKN